MDTTGVREAVGGSVLLSRADSSGRAERLEEHLHEVAGLCAEMGAGAVEKETCELAGRLHDVGKATLSFQRALAGEGPCPPHSHIGAALALQEGSFEAMYAIAGHHSGLHDGFGEFGISATTLEAEMGRLLEDRMACEQALREHARRLSPSTADKTAQARTFSLAMRVRMLASALVDADRVCAAGWDLGVSPRAVLARENVQASLRLFMKAAAEMESSGKRIGPASAVLYPCAARAVRSRATGVILLVGDAGQAAETVAALVGHAPETERSTCCCGLGETDDADFARAGLAGAKAQARSAAFGAPVLAMPVSVFLRTAYASSPRALRPLHNLVGSVIGVTRAACAALPRWLTAAFVAAMAELESAYGCAVLMEGAQDEFYSLRLLADGGPQVTGSRQLAREYHDADGYGIWKLASESMAWESLPVPAFQFRTLAGAVDDALEAEAGDK